MLSRSTHRALGGLALAQGGLLLGLAWARFSTVHQRTFDLALYARVAWGLAHGDLWSSVLNTHSLGAHLSPVLLPLGLLGRLAGTVPVLLTAQATCVALSLWPVARIGARHLGQRGLWLGAAAWLLYPNLGHVATYEFHPGTLAVLPLCWAFDALDRGNLKQLWGCAVASLACREDLALTAAMLGVAQLALHRDRKALWLVAGMLAYFAVAAPVVAAHGPPHGSLSQHFGPWGGTPLGVFGALIHEPARVLAHFRAPERLWYLSRVLAPFLFLSLRAPWLLAVALPALALNLISVFPTAQAQYSHYLTAAVPALVVSGVVGVASARTGFVRAAALPALTIAHVALGGLPWCRDFDRTAFYADAHTAAARSVLAGFVGGGSVQAPDALLPHLAERRVARRGPPPDAATEFVILDLSHRQRFAHTETLLRTVEEPLARRFLSRPTYALRVYAPPYALLQRGSASRAAGVLGAYFVRTVTPPRLGLALAACLTLMGAKLEPTKVELTFQANGACPSDLALRLGADPRPQRVDLLFDGALSPARLRAGDVVRSVHELEPALRAQIPSRGMWVGLLRQSGAVPEPADPIALRVPL